MKRTEDVGPLNPVDIWVEAAGAIAAAALLPFYMGYAHMSLFQLLVYAATAGLALTLADCLQFGLRGMTLGEFFGDLKLWVQLVLGLGVPAYLAALIAV